MRLVIVIIIKLAIVARAKDLSFKILFKFSMITIVNKFKTLWFDDFQLLFRFTYYL